MRKNPERENIIGRLRELLRDERLRQKLSINEVATRSGLSRAMVSGMEKGMRIPTIDSLLRIAEALGVDLYNVLEKATLHSRSNDK
ncbi:MAG: helix-turn-helix transcriptional regulator [Chthoniobacterales bacterium]|nr:helix-turn-helix transcriptional regulator [Chthoniobacterales bacterium]